MNFKQACEEKFEKGNKEHKQVWSPETIDWRNEIRGEVCDLYNYSTLMPNGFIKRAIQSTAEAIYNWMDEV